MMTRTTALAATCALCVTASASLASTFDGLVDFSAFANNTDITSLDFGGGVMATVSALSGTGSGATTTTARAFDTDPTSDNAAGTTDDDLVGPFTDANGTGDPLSFGTALIIQERDGFSTTLPDDERRGGSVTFTFNTAINLLSLFYLDGEEGATINANMQAIGGFGSGLSGDNKYVLIDFSGNDAAQGITQFRVDFAGSGAIGQFQIGVPTVPVPAGLPLLLTGFGALALARRRKHSR